MRTTRSPRRAATQVTLHKVHTRKVPTTGETSDAQTQDRDKVNITMHATEHQFDLAQAQATVTTATQPTTALSSLSDCTMGGQVVEGRGGGMPSTNQAAPPTPDLGAKPFVNRQNILEQPTVQPVALSPAPSQDTVVSTASGFGANRVQTDRDGKKRPVG